MITQSNFWEFLAGLGIFLLAMMLLEEALSHLAVRSFKRFLRRHTNHPLKAVLSGTLITAFLQSSSIVSLMVLAFVGAGVIELRNAIGIIIGSNLGTTFTGWITAYFGFGFDVESFALPFIAIGGLMMVVFSKQGRIYKLGQLVISFGALFLGLEYMKSSMSLLAEGFDVSLYTGYSPYLLAVVGFVLTAIIQSSSAAMVITLSALNAHLIPLEAAAAMVIGSDLGTTITVIIGGVKGSPTKKRVALSHFLFNFIVDIIALAFLFPLLRLLTEVLHFTNPLYTLVAFHSIFNLIGILIFLPFLKLFARFLERRFVSDDSIIAQFISSVPMTVPEAAVESMYKEARHLIRRVFVLHLTIFKLDEVTFLDEKEQALRSLDGEEQYALIKELEGEIVTYYIGVQNQKIEQEEVELLNQVAHAIRYAMSAAKGIKDVAHNFEEFHKSVNDDLINLMDWVEQNQLQWLGDLHGILTSQHPIVHFERLAALKYKSKQNYQVFLEKAYYSIQNRRFSEIEISTLFNVNREIHSSNKAILHAVKDLILEGEQVKDFEVLPEQSF